MTSSPEPSARYFANILDAIADPVFVKDEAHRWVTLNGAFCAMMGHPREALIGKSDPDFFPPAEVEVFWSVDDQVMATGEPNVNEEFLTDAHGRRLVIVTKKSLYVAEDGRKFIVGVIRDVTEQRRQERELAEQRRLLKDLIDHTPAGLAFMDRDLLVRWMNPAYERLMGQPASAYLDQGLTPRGRSSFEEPLQRAMATREPVRLDGIPFAVVGGSHPREAYWDVIYVPVLGEDGEPVGVLVFTLEVTDRMERERNQAGQISRLKELDRLKDQFVSMLSHELRTPIHTILGMATILEDEQAGPLAPDQQHYLQRMVKVTEGLLTLVNDLLDMSMLQSGQFVIHPREIALGEVVAGVVANLSPMAAEQQLELVDEVSEDLPPVVADEQRVGQVLANLLGNAIKFTPAGGRITITAREQAGQLRCEVRDTGPGIAAADLPRLFQRFAQLDSKLTRAAKGTGLGLSISKGLVEAHGGSIGVESEPGVGSTFWFTLPL